MKLTKKAAALLLAASLAVSVCATPVFAAIGPSATLDTTNADAALSTMGTETQTEVIYKVGSSYSWTIPTKIDFGSTAGVNATVKVNADGTAQTAANNQTHTDGTAEKVEVTKNTIPVGTSLKISISADTPYETTGTAGESGFYVEQKHATNTAVRHLYYTIAKTKGGSPLEHTAEIMKVESGTATGDQALYFALNTSKDEVEMAGIYKANLKFEAEVVNNT